MSGIVHMMVTTPEPAPTGPGSRRVALVIQSSQVSGAGALADLPVLLSDVNLPTAMFDADGTQPAQNGGGDLRFTTDLAGDVRLACEVVSFVTDNNPANGSAEVWVRVPSVSESANTTVYCWFTPGGALVQPAVDAAFGRDAVWTDYIAVWHGDDTTDASGNGNTLSTGGGSPAAGDTGGKIGAAFAFPNTSAYYSAGSAAALDNVSPVTWQTWANLDNTPGDFTSLLSKSTDGLNGPDLYFGGSTGYIGWYNGAADYYESLGLFSLDTWFLAHGTWDGTTGTNNGNLYINGSSVGSTTNSIGGNLNDAANPFRIGTFDGFADEVRMRGSVLSADWIATEHAMQNTPAAFVIAAAIEAP